jgi:hypothetical protein
MKNKMLLILSLTLLLQPFAFAQIEERSVDFTVSPSVLLGGQTQVAFEWLSPQDFNKTDMSLMDLTKVHALSPSNNQLIASKIALLSKKPFDSFSAAKMNNATYISQMLSSVAISQKGADLWAVTNKVKAYSIPFKVNFDLRLKEIPAQTLGIPLLNYFKDEGSALKGTGRERFIVLDMTNFSQLMYRNYSIVYVKEISANETLIVAGIIAGFNLNSANAFFNYPPFSTTKGTMMNNLRTQILTMASKIKN